MDYTTLLDLALYAGHTSLDTMPDADARALIAAAMRHDSERDGLDCFATRECDAALMLMMSQPSVLVFANAAAVLSAAARKHYERPIEEALYERSQAQAAAASNRLRLYGIVDPGTETTAYGGWR